MEGDDSPWLKMHFWEVPEVQGHDGGGPAGNRRGQNVPVFLVICHTGNQGPWPVTHASPKCESSSL